MRPAAPSKPPTPATGIVSTGLHEKPAAPERFPAASESVEDAAGPARGAAMHFDIRFWRGGWFWRLAVKATVRFFRPGKFANRGDQSSSTM